MNSADYKERYEEEKKRARTWMIVSIVVIIVGVIILIGAGLLIWLREEPKCPVCVVSPEDIARVQDAAAEIDEFQSRVELAAAAGKSLGTLDVSGTCPGPNGVRLPAGLPGAPRVGRPLAAKSQPARVAGPALL